MKGKQIFIIWLAIYPLITILGYFIGPYLKGLHFTVSNLIMTGIVVPIMIHWAIPLSTKVVTKLHIITGKIKSISFETNAD